MHDHLYYLQRPDTDAAGSEGPTLLPQMNFSAPRMYLANGVTTIRTAGSVEPYADINLLKLIDAGTLIGPHIEPAAPYLQGPSDIFMQMHTLTGPADATAFVNFWAASGSTNSRHTRILREPSLAALRMTPISCSNPCVDVTGNTDLIRNSAEAPRISNQVVTQHGSACVI